MRQKEKDKKDIFIDKLVDILWDTSQRLDEMFSDHVGTWTAVGQRISMDLKREMGELTQQYPEFMGYQPTKQEIDEIGEKIRNAKKHGFKPIEPYIIKDNYFGMGAAKISVENQKGQQK